MDRDWRRRFGVVPEIEIEKGYIRFAVSQRRPIPWDEFAPLAIRSIHKVTGMRAELAGTAEGGALVLDGSGEKVRLVGEAKAGRRVWSGRIERRDGATILTLD